jgi:hypothetical protein
MKGNPADSQPASDALDDELRAIPTGDGAERLPLDEADPAGDLGSSWATTSPTFVSGRELTEDDLAAELRRLATETVQPTAPAAPSSQPAAPATPPPSTAPLDGQPGPEPALDWLHRTWSALLWPRRGTPRPIRQRPATDRSTRRRWGVGTEALLLAIATRLVLAGVVWLSLRIFPRWPLYPVQLPDSFFPNHLALDGWARWDAAHYVAIAAGGYGGDNPSPDGGLGFFPLYPLLMRGAVAAVGAAPTPTALALAGIVIANLCFLIAVPLLARVGAGLFGEQAGRQAAVLVCLTPFGFFFNAAYSESLFLVLAIGSLALANRGRWWAAAALAALASATRLVGLALAPALLLLALRRPSGLREQLAAIVLAPAGAIAWFAYTAIEFDDPLAYFRAQATWGGWREHVRFYAELFVRQPREALVGDPRHLIIVLNVAIGLLCLALIPRVWRSLDPGTALFTTLLVVIQFAFTWVSLGRYLLPAFGLYLAGGALLTHPRLAGWPRDAVVIGGSLLLSLLAVLYAHAFWVV